MIIITRNLILIFLVLSTMLHLGSCAMKAESKLRRHFTEITPLIENGEYERALDSLEQMEIQYREELEKDKEVYAKLLYEKGRCCDFLGRFAEAISYFEKAVTVQKEYLPLGHPNFASCFNGLGNVYILMGEFDLATDYFNQSLSINLASKGKSHPETGNSYNNLGNTFYEKGNYRQAAKHYQQAGEIWLKTFGPVSADMASFYNNMGNTYNVRGFYQKAIAYYKKAATTLQKAQKGEHPELAAYINNLAAAYQLDGSHDKAILYALQGEQIIRQSLSADHPDLAYSHYILSGSRYALKAYKQAEEHAKEAIRVWRLALGEGNSDEGYFQLILGDIYTATKQFSKAKASYEEALEIWLSNHGEVHPNVSSAYRKLAELYKESGPLKASIDFSQKSLDALAYTSLAKFKNIEAIPQLIEALRFRGEFFEDRYKTNGNLSDLEQAYTAFREAIAALEYQQQQSRHPDTKFNLAEEAHILFEKAIGLALRLNPNNQGNDYLPEVFSYMEKSKTLILQEAMKQAEALSFAGIPAKLLSDEYELHVNLNALEQKRNMLLSQDTPEDDTTVQNINDRLFDLNQAYELLQKRLEKNYPAYYKLKYDIGTVSLAQTQKSLKPEQTVLEFFVGDENIYLLLLQQDFSEVITIENGIGLKKTISKLVEGIKNYHTASFLEQNDALFLETARAYTTAAQNLYQQLIGPVNMKLTSSLVIVPDAELNYLPFELLLPDQEFEIGKFKTYPYLLKTHDIHYNYSMTLLAEMKNKGPKHKAQKKFLAFAPFHQDGYTFHQNQFGSVTTSSAGESSNGEGLHIYKFPKLTRSLNEVTIINSLMNGDILGGTEATESKFRAIAADYRILHLATHGKTSDTITGEAYLAFAEIPDKIENELLFVGDLYSQRLQADLVVLSACETGIGEIRKGEGVLSISRAFAYAGTKSILTSLWTVDDDATSDLMVLFYTYLKKGYSKSQAIQAAKLAFMEENPGVGAHPFFWAGFISIGDPSALRI